MKNDSEILQEAVDAILSEFLDEYIILGKKAGIRQRMVVASVTPGEKEISGIYTKVMNWAYKRKDDDGEV